MRHLAALVAALGVLGAPQGRSLRAEEPPPPAPPVVPAPAEPGSEVLPAGSPAAAAPGGGTREGASPALDGTLSLVSLARHVRPSVLVVEVRGPGRAPITRHAVVVDARGWLVMAGPTIGPADTVLVRLQAGLSVPATPVGSDARTALTLLQLPQVDVTLQPLALPKAEPRKPLTTSLEVGAQVVMVTGTGAVAIGRVRALERVRTIVDAAHGTTERTTGLVEAAVASVAHDVGSPWVDSQGRCVGLLVGGIAEVPLGEETAPPDLEIRMEPVAAHAVSAQVVALVWPMLRDHQSVQRSRLGVKAQPAGEALRKHLCGGCGGQEVISVDVGGPAALAGIEAEDLLLALDGVALRAGATLGDSLLPYRPLDTVTLTVLRRGDRLTRTVVLAPR